MRKTTLSFTDAQVPDQAEWLDLPGCVASPCCVGILDTAVGIGKILPGR